MELLRAVIANNRAGGGARCNVVRSSRFGGVVPLAGWRHPAHHSPNHGSWLNIAGIEISVVARNCLVRPCPNLQTLAQRTAALGAERDAQWRTVSWQFTTTQARKRVHRLCLDLNAKVD